MFNLKSLLIEDEHETRPAATVPAPQPMTIANRSFDPVINVPAQGGSIVVDEDNSVYQKLVDKTDFSSSPQLSQSNKYLTPLSSLPLDDKTKFKIALAQAQAQESLDPTTLVQIFDSLNQVLATEAQNFTALTNKATQDKVDSVKQRAADLQAQAAQLTKDAFDAQQKIQTARFKFESAVGKRQAEILLEKDRYASLLA